MGGMATPFVAMRVRVKQPGEQTATPATRIVRCAAGQGDCVSRRDHDQFRRPHQVAMCRGQALDASPDFNHLQAEQEQAWQADWDRFSVVLPDRPYAGGVLPFDLLHALCHRRHAVPPGRVPVRRRRPRKMHPFTIGTPAWAALALAAINHEERARRILDNLFTPETIASNAQLYWFLFSWAKGR